MEIKDLLPIGSVIWLKDAERPLMIFGIKQENEDTHEEYDYIGVLYPEGNIGTESQYLFMHSQIEKVVFKGYDDTSREMFIKKLSKYYNDKH